MTRTKHNERGDTLIEIILAIVIIGAVVGAFFASFTTASNSTKYHRDLVTADGLLRDYAEAIKAGVQRDCPTHATYSAAEPSHSSSFTIAALPNHDCPASGIVLSSYTLQVTLPNGTVKSLTIKVRKP